MSLEELRNAEFFLLNYGHGYTDVGVREMTYTDLAWHVKKLNEKLKTEHDARVAANKKIAQKAAAAKYRSR